MLPRKFATAMLVLFQQYSEKFCFFFALNSECFSKYHAFYSHIVDLCLLKALGLLLSKRFEIMEKLYS